MPALMSRCAADFAHLGQTSMGGSVMRWTSSHSWPQAVHPYSYVGMSQEIWPPWHLVKSSASRLDRRERSLGLGPQTTNLEPTCASKSQVFDGLAFDLACPEQANGGTGGRCARDDM